MIRPQRTLWGYALQRSYQCVHTHPTGEATSSPSILSPTATAPNANYAIDGRQQRKREGVEIASAHPLIPPKGLRVFSTSASSVFVTSPRARACFVAWRSRSGERPARAQSLSVRRGEVTGTAPFHDRSCAGTSA